MFAARQGLEKLRNVSSEDPIFTENIFSGLSKNLHDLLLQKSGYSYYKGKVRDIYAKGETIYLVHTDRLSAFDCIIANVPYKGCLLNLINQFWQMHAQKVCPNFYFSLPHPRVLKGQNVSPIKIEVVVRGYLAGSMLRDYEKGQRDFWGNILPDKMQPYSPLPQVVLTPTSKEEVFKHDEPIAVEDIIKRNLCSESEWRQIARYALDLFSLGQDIFSQKGWILVDTKYEFGRSNQGDIILIDEAHTPDSSRLWKKSSYAAHVSKKKPPEMFDKENIRRYLISQGFMGEGPIPKIPSSQIIDLALSYLDILESLTERPLLLENPHIITADLFAN